MGHKAKTYKNIYIYIYTNTHTHIYLILHLPYCDKGHIWRKLVLQILGTPNTEKHTLAQHSPTSSLAPGTGLGMIQEHCMNYVLYSYLLLQHLHHRTSDTRSQRRGLLLWTGSAEEEKTHPTLGVLLAGTCGEAAWPAWLDTDVDRLGEAARDEGLDLRPRGRKAAMP